MNQNTGFTLWITGMSGSGKTTLAEYVSARLRQVGRPVEVLDEGELKESLWTGDADTKEERVVNVRRLGLVANLLSRNGVAALVPAVSPYKGSREENRRLISRYVEVYVDCPTDKLIQRDTTGRYKKALAGEIPNFIGITEPYEPPTSPEVTIHSDGESVEDGGLRIFQALLDLGLVTGEELKTITGKKMKANPPKKTTRRSAGAAATATKARPPVRAARVGKATAKRRR